MKSGFSWTPLAEYDEKLKAEISSTKDKISSGKYELKDVAWFLQLKICEKGDGYCMDVARERAKLADMLTNELQAQNLLLFRKINES